MDIPKACYPAHSAAPHALSATYARPAQPQTYNNITDVDVKH